MANCDRLLTISELLTGLSQNVERWTATTTGPFGRKYFLRIVKTEIQMPAQKSKSTGAAGL